MLALFSTLDKCGGLYEAYREKPCPDELNIACVFSRPIALELF